MQAVPILIPLINPNEPEAWLAALLVNEGQPIAKGDPICTLETTKSTADLQSDADGFVTGLRLAAGQTVRAGDLLGYIASSPDWIPPQESQPATPPGDLELPAGLRITQPALRLARQHNLQLQDLPKDQLITEPTVRELVAKHAGSDLLPLKSAFDPSAIIVYGGGGHGKSLIDLLRALAIYRIVAVVDDGLPAGSQIMGISLMGGAAALDELHDRGVRLAVNAVGGIGNVAVRINIFHRLAEAGFVCPAVAHPTAWIEPSASVAPGVQIFPHAYVGSETRVGFGAIVNTGAIVSHDCSLGDFTNISPGAMLAGGVQVGNGALVGMGATVNLEVKIGAGARIGNGATVKSDVPPNGIVRAGATWPE